MIKKLITLFRLGRKIAKSDILDIASKFQQPPLMIKILFKILSFSLSSKKQNETSTNDGEKLSKTLFLIFLALINKNLFFSESKSFINFYSIA